ncbi:MAG: shikimate synthase [Oligoflexia bacterium]|nr:shikimate synthase [Oligoflexia bacterium]
MITLLVGHRGTGKSSLLERIASYYRDAGRGIRALDLDRAIVEAEKLPIGAIFSMRGEAEFRSLERSALARLIDEHRAAAEDVFIATGAGLEGPPPPEARCLWVRRPSDPLGRVFVDSGEPDGGRPRLDPEKAPLEEYLGRYGERQKRYRQWSEDVLTVPEGFGFPNPWERGFFLNTLAEVGGILTLPPELFESEARLRAYLARRLAWGVRFELRDDLLGAEELKLALARIPHDRILLSLRKGASHKGAITSLKPGALWDWPAEWALPSTLRPSILSLHEREGGTSVLEAGRRLERLSSKNPKTLLKLAVEARDFDELLEGHRWAMENPGTRSFLPRSTSGRWAWYRMLNKGRFKINFVREGEGSAPDQPYLLEWLRTPDRTATFAAILGNPVLQSHTPAEQLDYFASRGMPVFAVALTEDEWDNGALEALHALGLRAAAVTSPLKLNASRSAKVRTPEAERFQSVNTLHWNEPARCWSGHNTDLDGLRALFEPLRPESQVAVWGAQGTLPLLKSMLPCAAFYSARSGEKRPGPETTADSSPEVVVWGIGRSRQADSKRWPPESWRPSLIIDLNYSEDSPGREYAMRTGARYVSGMAMFRKQAEAQRRYWDTQFTPSS